MDHLNHWHHHLLNGINHLAEQAQGEFDNLKESECIHDTFFDKTMNQKQLCYISKNNCDEQYDFINFFEISYCYLQGNLIISCLLSAILILLIFKFISSVVEEYLAPSISYISEWLGLSEALAAVTLLALANGAGDVITALVASGSEGGLSYNIGAIYGAGLFVTSIVVALTIQNSVADIQLEPMSIWRDVGIYIIATLSVITFGFIGELSSISAGVMLFEYSMLVLIVYVDEKRHEVNNERKIFLKNKKEEKEDGEQPSEQNSQRQDPFQNLNIIKLPENKTEEELKAESKRWKNVLSKINTASPTERMRLLAESFKKSVLIALKMVKKQELKETSFHDMNTWEKFNFIIDLPFDYARKLTLPPCEPEKYEKKWACIFPIPGLIFLFFVAILKPELWFLYVGIPLGGLISIIIYKTSPEDQPPKYYIFLELFGTIGALFWTYLVSGILIDLLQYLGMLSKLDKTYLGLTVIAVGNALPDAVTTIALAKQGYAMMGLTGAYAGQLFGLLVGFGLALLRKTIQEGSQVFDIFNQKKLNDNLMIIFVILVSLLNLVMTFVFGILNKYKFNKLLAKLLGGLYVVFVLVASIIAIKKALT